MESSKNNAAQPNNSAKSNGKQLNNSAGSAGPVSALGATPVPHYTKPFPDVSKIEVFGGQHFRRWQERISSTLDMHGVAAALTDPQPDSSADPKQIENWTYANKVCRYVVLSTLSNELFDVYCSYNLAKEI